ncbi:DNA/RNA non-specific endonuclease [Cellulosimicrobium marinum]|uniref:DNA/RNA non-specific endonuclease n=1 Tax=Cellulosimicrobium marinum TaxID=1638992 RepID=UPI001E41F06C|nr:DNA/RNA non-specific endonuclease [Cellulosimicrobium marinum]MCB7135551.1 DNA/RNA non-specific endonuclease [Cellulosimicrobium marinum]
MTGHDPDFLGVPVPLPEVGREVRVLPSTHFTVLLDPLRRLAAATVVDVDGAQLVDVPRDDDWHLDPRVAADEQTGPELYARNDLDRGHLVRRRDPVWGDPATAARANTETFAYPNAAPQAARFNQSLDLWNGLEDHVLEHARTLGLRLVVETGPVLAADDPVYRGVGIPRLFWKVVTWAAGGGVAAGPVGTLAATAFVLDQTPQLGELELRAADARALAAGDVPPLGPFRTFQVPVGDVKALTGLDLGPLVAADVLVPAPAAAGVADRAGWRELGVRSDVVL